VPVAKRLLEKSGVNKVVLLPVAINGAKAKDWRAGPAAKTLSAALAVAKAKNIVFDYAIWQQGSADADTPSQQYLEQMRSTIKETSLAIKIDKWLIAEAGACLGKAPKSINAAQKKLGQQFVLNRLPGASDSALNELEQLSNCNFSMQGQERMAQRWFEAIQNADALSKRYQRETLIELFK
jgi:hypothetical protein